MEKFCSFIKKFLPPWAEVVDGREEEALLDTIARVSEEALLDDKLEWISHREYLVMWASPADGGHFLISADYRGNLYKAVVEIVDSGLKYLEPWEEVMG